MEGEDRDKDKILVIAPEKSRKTVSLDVIKSRYIAEGLSPENIAEEYGIAVSHVLRIVEDNKLPELRKAYLVQGIKNIQNIQLLQSQKLMDIENSFKKLRILQLEKELQHYVIYYERHGDFYKRHPTSGEVLTNSDGIPMQLKIPNVSREINQLKESVTMSEGVRQVLGRLDEIINSGPKTQNIYEGKDAVVEVDYAEFFESNDD